jgi:hypothetical protein
MADADNTQQRAMARALSSPLRMRILRFCLHESRTNREIAHEFDLNPGTSLHHVRTLVDTGFLAAEAARSGKRGSTEIPYIATKRSWDFPAPQIGPILVQAFLEEIQGVRAEDLGVSRLGLMLNDESLHELQHRLNAVLIEYKERTPDADGRPVSVMIATHPEQRRTP